MIDPLYLSLIFTPLVTLFCLLSFSIISALPSRSQHPKGVPEDMDYGYLERTNHSRKEVYDVTYKTPGISPIVRLWVDRTHLKTQSIFQYPVQVHRKSGNTSISFRVSWKSFDRQRSDSQEDPRPLSQDLFVAWLRYMRRLRCWG